MHRFFISRDQLHGLVVRFDDVQAHQMRRVLRLRPGDRVVALEANPGRVVEIVEIALPRPRDQLTTREHPRFLEYRHRLFGHLAKKEAE